MHGKICLYPVCFSTDHSKAVFCRCSIAYDFVVPTQRTFLVFLISRIRYVPSSIVITSTGEDGTGRFGGRLAIYRFIYILRFPYLYRSHVARKHVFGVCDQLRLIPACSATETRMGLDLSAIARQDKRFILSRQEL